MNKNIYIIGFIQLVALFFFVATSISWIGDLGLPISMRNGHRWIRWCTMFGNYFCGVTIANIVWYLTGNATAKRHSIIFFALWIVCWLVCLIVMSYEPISREEWESIMGGK